MEINATPEDFLNWLQAFHRRHRYLLLTFGGQGKLDLQQQKWNETIRYIAVPSGKKGDSPRDGIGIIVDIQYPANSEAIDVQIYPVVYSHEWRSGISGEEAVAHLESIGKTDAAAYLQQLTGAMEQKWMPMAIRPHLQGTEKEQRKATALRLWNAGLTGEEVGEKMNISARTVRRYIKEAKQKQQKH